MKRLVINLLLIGIIIAAPIRAAQHAVDPLLTGEVMGYATAWDYTTNRTSTTVNMPAAAFDGDLNTFCASNDRSYSWVGLDLGEPYIITQVGWSPRNDGVGPDRVRLAVFEGANRPDFMDALPLYIVPSSGTIGQVSTAAVNCSKGFRYVRYVGPSDARCNVAEVQFYGHPGTGTDEQLVQLTGIPTITIHTVNNEHPYDKIHEIDGYVSVISKGGTNLMQDTATTRLRGNASLEFPKKPYQIRFDQKHHALPGSPAKAKKWVLIPNYGDKTLMRNLLAFHLDSILGAIYTPYAKPVDLIVNGEYKGCYQLADKVEINPGRIDIDEMLPTDIAGDSLTGGYLIEMDGYYYNETSWFRSSHNIPLTIQEPSDTKIVPQQSAYIQQAYQELEDCLFGGNYTNANNGYRTKMNLESFLIHFLTNQLAANPDNYWSCNIYKPRGDVFYFGPVWDFDIAFHNDYRQGDQNSASSWIYGAADNSPAFAKRVLTDGSAVYDLEMVYAKARDDKGLTPEAIGLYIDSLAAAMDASQRLNFTRWPILNQNVHMNYTARGSYEAEVAFLRDWMIKRIAWTDRKLHYTPGRSHVGLDDLFANGSSSGLGNGTSDALVRIFSLQGILLFEGASCTDLPTLPSGFYIVSRNGHAEKLYLQ